MNSVEEKHAVKKSIRQVLAVRFAGRSIPHPESGFDRRSSGSCTTVIDQHFATVGAFSPLCEVSICHFASRDKSGSVDRLSVAIEI